MSREQWNVLRCDLGYWKKRHAMAKVREAGHLDQIKQLRQQCDETLRKYQQLQAEHEQLRGAYAFLQRLLFGRKSESKECGEKKGAAAQGAASGSESKPSRRRKRTKPDSQKRHDYSHLPEAEETVSVAGECSVCGLPYVSNGYEESELLEVVVQFYRRLIRRQRKRAVCGCGGRAVVAPSQRLFANTRYGASVWAWYLFERYMMHQTVGGFCRFTQALGLELSKSTLVNHNAAFLSLFEGFYDAICEHQGRALKVHGDETSWPLQQAGIVGGEHHRGWLWVCLSEEAVLVHIDRRRNTEAARRLLGHLSQGEEPVVLVCDRYGAYKKLAKDTKPLCGEVAFQLAFCWVHVRRDFIKLAEGGDGDLKRYKIKWLNRCGKLFALNKKRRAVYDAGLPMAQQSAEFHRLHEELEQQLKRLFTSAENELQRLGDGVKAAPLKSLLKHRAGLSVFVDKPQVPMDNNGAERTLRPMVISRWLSQGSKSAAGADLMSCMLSVVETLKLHQVNVYGWLVDYLTACGANGGAPPQDLSRWLPWQMEPARLQQLQRGFVPPPAKLSSARPRGP